MILIIIDDERHRCICVCTFISVETTRFYYYYIFCIKSENLLMNILVVVQSSVLNLSIVIFSDVIVMNSFDQTKWTVFFLLEFVST